MKDVVIRDAVILLSGSIRLQVLEASEYKRSRGNADGRWYEFKDAGARNAFRMSGMTEGRKFAIPARAEIGSDQITELEIDWSQKFRHRGKLLAHWVMEG